MQIIIIEYGGRAFGTKSLSISEWFACIGIGFISIPIGFILRILKFETIFDSIISNEETYLSKQNKSLTRGKELWIRGYKRIRTQLLVINAFKNGMSSLYGNRLTSYSSPTNYLSSTLSSNNNNNNNNISEEKKLNI